MACQEKHCNLASVLKENLEALNFKSLLLKFGSSLGF